MKEEGQFGAAPPGTIIRCRGTLKYPACPIGRRSPVTPLRYAQELYAATLCCFADPLQAFSSRALFSLSLCASSLFLSTLFSFFFISFLLPWDVCNYAAEGCARCISAGTERIANPFSRERPPETAELAPEWSVDRRYKSTRIRLRGHAVRWVTVSH